MSPQTGATRLVLPPSPVAPTNLRAAITAHLDDWAEQDLSLRAEQQVDGYRAALDLAVSPDDLNRIATELGVVFP